MKTAIAKPAVPARTGQSAKLTPAQFEKKAPAQGQYAPSTCQGRIYCF